MDIFMNLQTQQPLGILLNVGYNKGRYGISLVPFGLKKQFARRRNLGLEAFTPSEIVPIEYNYF